MTDPIFSWNRLPQELRLLILESVVDQSENLRLKTIYPQPEARIGHLASVCRDWQQVVEKNTFRRIVLGMPDLPQFAKAVRGKNVVRLNYIRHLWFRIRLPTYTCRSCMKPEDEMTIIRYANYEFTFT